MAWKNPRSGTIKGAKAPTKKGIQQEELNILEKTLENELRSVNCKGFSHYSGWMGLRSTPTTAVSGCCVALIY